MPILIVITGAPATGKTTLARRLASDLRLALLAKDDVKEALAKVSPAADRQASQRLGRAGIAVLFRVAERCLLAGVPVIVEANFSRRLSSPELTAILGRTGSRAVQILLDADAEAIRERYQVRAGDTERHPSHLDATVLREWASAGVPASEALDIPGTLIRFDTTDFGSVDYAALRERVAALVAG